MIGTRQRGFTLIELAVVLVIAGLMVGFALKVLQAGPNDKCYEITRVQLADIQQSIENFVRDNNRYPMPAVVTYGNKNGEFGKESAGVYTSAGVMYGALPNQALGLATDMAADCWGSKFTYAVAQGLTTTPGYAGSILGNIRMRNGSFASYTTLSSMAAYVVVSHGNDKAGATPLSANSVAAGSCSVTGTKIDSENCDVVSGANGIFYNATFNNGKDAANFFDDLIIYADKANIILDCEIGSAKWSSDQCGATTTDILADGATLTARPSTAPPGMPGYTGSADIKCIHGVLTPQNTVCAPDSCGSDCSYTNPRSGTVQCMTEGNSNSYGDGICQRYSCCSGTIEIENLSPCPIVDSMDTGSSCLTPPPPTYDCVAGDHEGGSHNAGCSSLPNANAGGSESVQCYDSYASGLCSRTYQYSCSGTGWVNDGMTGQSGNCE